MEIKQKKEPVRQIQRGLVLASIWFNPTTGKEGRYTVTFDRLLYREAKVQTTGSFHYNDLGNIRRVARLAQFYLWWKGAAQRRYRRRFWK